ncbi:MAG: nitroreductase family protein [Deltaproteobacteria bacterium]|nr:nitroreductase family protein [Deltaproteobacteria bacterium]MBW1908118.1 nitroreductase family protein [Deltaproteobacteria bacterium]MBW2033988.1 nitroreductase family protein [Deltaproteobacteria bacterium]MBW2114786.1 nitroreductase family protein [Deltaproteobacteria bacterium]MBW2357860.1 nitroreductase family protein [Deltaproteobacteria bacterium]
MAENTFLPLTDYCKLPESEMKRRASEFYVEMRKRHTVREFSDQPVDRNIIEDCLRTAATAPSGANQQPWSFIAVSDFTVKRRIREAAEKIEKEFYSKEITRKWRDALKHLKTGPSKPFLEIAPYLIAIFSQSYSYSANGEKTKHYYVTESVGIATGMLITALHHAGLVTLTYTPVNMRFLNKILSRPSNEKPFMILVVGYPSEAALVPAIQKKALEDISVFI